MSALHRVSLLDVPATPWRNGGGTTRELLAWPPGAAVWQLRVSVAAIVHSGPFSPYPGVKRWFAVLQGAGVSLALPEGEVTRTRDDDALAFDGEAAPRCHLVEGPTLDLNLMLQRDAGEARMWRAAPGEALTGPAAWRGVFAAGAAQLELESGSEPLPAGTLAWSDAADAEPWVLHQGHPGPAWFMMLQR